MKGLNINNSILCFLMMHNTNTNKISTTGANAKNIWCKYKITENTMYNNAYIVIYIYILQMVNGKLRAVEKCVTIV